VFARIAVSLKKDAAGAFPEDVVVRSMMKKLGFDIPFRTNPDGTPIDTVRISSGGAEIEVKAGSNAHFRNIASRTLDAATPPATRSEIERFGIYTGASSKFQANIFISRANAGDVTIFLYQASLDQLIPCSNI
jgi:hypothetical protein